ncbi:MAG: hypothetical protein HEQ38_04675 [Gemmatimonas sp.]|nr:hypothetical protein [Gemmatimonas sp.]
MRFMLLTAIAASTSLAALGFDPSGRPMRVTQSACEMDAFPASRARSSLCNASFRADLGADAALVDGGMLFRLTPNRFILATPLPNKYSGITYLALDSNAVIVRNNP